MVLITAKTLKKKFLEFFKSKGHAIIESSPLIPVNDPTVLFTNAGMHPLVPYILGQKHPLGKRLASVQKCLRTQDIDEVGDNRHTTFFEMLGNWSLNDYFKKESIEWSYEFLVDCLKLDKNMLAVTCFAGEKTIPKDKESANIWLSLGIPKERIAFLGKENNFWQLPGDKGPCGPDTEIFYWFGEGKPPKVFDPEDLYWLEIWNNVFIQFNKNKGKFELLGRNVVDTGVGLERVAMILQNKKTIFDTELFLPLFKKIEELSGKKPTAENIYSFRVIADHMRASVFILGDELDVKPGNMDKGYILRRFIRRIVRHSRLLGINKEFCSEIAKIVIEQYKEEYPILAKKEHYILEELRKEEIKFRNTLEKGIKEFEKLAKKGSLNVMETFLLFQSYGFPIELTQELAKEKGFSVDLEGFQKEFKKHQVLSRIGAENKFKGGLASSSKEETKHHTATHLLNEALRKIVSKDIKQKGSNITSERLRFDFNFDRKLTEQEIKKVEDEVNKIIKQKLEVKKEEMLLEKALKSGCQAEFGQKYPEKVSVYSVGNYSKEICMGPHVANTKELGKFKIVKEEACAQGIRRIKAVLE